ncbi:MAG TPA: glycoside hydrolase family 3 N-terminal domain-containing protein [Spirochaetales bacterium]|nr:glycoside hydrolase family 3 N-terminal domain-containing protein [Spirochaetales bacterium]HRY53064.1 glycoside hydrolase family 3 N-terminal domain-containing protein [Spirochaetia bacterium]
MSDEEVLGQLLMLAYPGEEPPPELFAWIEKRGLGGVKIFGWNADDTDRLAAATASLQQAALRSGSGVPLLVATDQEGGWIRHVKGATTVTTGNMAIGASGLPYDAYRSAEIIGRELAALGVNMNFAPTVDLATKPSSPIIGPRAFSDDPMEAAVLGAAYARGLAASGVIATAKHFPGHGGTELDSHGTLPVIGVDARTFRERELLPFRLLAAEGVPAVMSGHLSYPLVSGERGPASLSPYFMTELLRHELGFRGIAVTDDLFMNGAIGNGLPFSEACVKAILAGNDILMVSKMLGLEDPAWHRLLAAYRSDPAFRARARQSAQRVLETKLSYLKPRGKTALLPDRASLGRRLPDPEAAAFFKEQAYRSATAVRSEGLPFAAPGKLLLAGPFADFLAAGEAAYPGAARFKFSYKPEEAAQAAELELFEKALAGAEAAVVCVANQAGLDFAERARKLGARVAIVSVQSPAPLAKARWASPAVAVYGYSPESLRAAFDVLTGKERAQGRLPVKLGP